MNKFIRYVQGMMLLLTLAASGCTQAGENESSGGNMRGYNGFFTPFIKRRKPVIQA
ncbi:hypothetical protein [Ewingella americana]|uniref:hypothetical protein n=1 Tax=Ewingella americana TaxID=41202 RepID=UPI0013867368|nr:hypothetical protein [Ewingella americana]